MSGERIDNVALIVGLDRLLAERASLEAENQRLRKALERIAEGDRYGDFAQPIARDALEGRS